MARQTSRKISLALLGTVFLAFGACGPSGLFGPVTIRRAARRSALDATPAPGLAH